MEIVALFAVRNVKTRVNREADAQIVLLFVLHNAKTKQVSREDVLAVQDNVQIHAKEDVMVNVILVVILVVEEDVITLVIVV